MALSEPPNAVGGTLYILLGADSDVLSDLKIDIYHVFTWIEPSRLSSRD